MVTDSDGNTAELPFAWTVVPDTELVFAEGTGIGDQSWTGGLAIVPFTVPEATGGNEPLTYTVEGLPAGVSFDETTREVSGTPEAEGSGEARVMVTDSDGNTAELPFAWTVAPPDTVPVFAQGVSIADQQYTVGQPVSLELPEATGGNPPFSYRVTPALPSGLQFDGATRELRGTPDAGHPATGYTYAVTDGDGDQATLEFLITVEEETSGQVLSATGFTVSLSALGRVFATGAVDAIGSRLAAPLNRGTQATLGGVPVGPGFLGAVAGRWSGGRRVGIDGAPLRGPRADSNPVSLPTARTLLGGSAFEFTPTDGTAQWRLWGQGRVSGFGNRAQGVAVDGDVLGGYVGLDLRPRADTVLGVALSWQDGAVTYQEATQGGEMDLTLGSVLPYVQWQPHERVRLWGLGGVGWGTADVRSEDGASAETDLSLRLGALGMNYALAEGGLDWTVKTDAFLVELAADEADGLPEAQGEARRVRVALAGQGDWGATATQRWRPSVEVGVRYDDGDAATGGGIELGGGLGYTDTALGLVVETQARVLMAHEAKEFDEWGAGAQVRYAPGVGAQGLKVQVASTYGAVASRTGALWGQGTPGLAGRVGPAAARLAANVGSGVRLWQGLGLVTPYGGLTWAGRGTERGYRLGGQWALKEAFQMTLEGEERQAAVRAAEHRLSLTVQWQF